MNKYVVISLILLLAALIFSVFLFWFISTNYEIKNPVAVSEELTVVPEELSKEAPIKVDQVIEETANESLSLKDVPLTDEQVEILTKAGVDVDTYVVTPELITCFETSLSEERWAAIVAGSKPGVLEIAKIIPCLN